MGTYIHIHTHMYTQTHISKLNLEQNAVVN